jgi:hypothetical protein
LVVGKIPLDELPTADTEGDADDLPGPSILYNSVKVKTVGPTPLPVVSEPLTFCLHLVVPQ